MAEPARREPLGAESQQRGDLAQQRHTPQQGHWPHQLSHQPTLRVGDVLGALSHDFPSLTTSKVRFLDTQGLVVPQRTPAGYRLYSAADVERLRFVLRQQRDAYAPLSVIRERLELLDAGAAHQPLSLAAVGFERSDVVTIEEAARLTGATTDMIALLASEGIVEQSAPGRFERSDVALHRCMRALSRRRRGRATVEGALEGRSARARGSRSPCGTTQAPRRRPCGNLLEAHSPRRGRGCFHGVCAARRGDTALNMVARPRHAVP